MRGEAAPGRCSPRRPRAKHHGGGTGGLTATRFLLLGLLIVALPTSVLGVFFPQQNVTDQGVLFCGFYDIKRYTAWCNSSINAVVASNLSCVGYGVCIPLEGDQSMPCTNSTYCNGLRRGGKAVPACLSLESALADTEAVCDVDIQGASLYDMPPPSPPPPRPNAPPDEKKSRDWPLWKTMTIVFSIVGFALFVVVVVLLILWYRKRKAKTSETPVKLLTEDEKQQLDQETQGQDQQQLVQGQTQGQVQAQGQGQPAGEGVVRPLPPWLALYAGLPGGAPDMTVALRPVAPNGKPILAYGSTYPVPQSLAGSILPAGHRQLPPNAGDALLRAAVSSREAYNGPPMRRAPVPLPPPVGTPGGWPGGWGATAAPGGMALQMTAATAAADTGLASAVDAMSLKGAVGADEGLPPAVMPAALVPLTAATLKNPTAAS